MRNKVDQQQNTVSRNRYDKTEKTLGTVNGITYSLAGWIVGAFVAAAGGASNGVFVVLLSPILGAVLTAAKLCSNREKYNLHKGLLFYFASAVLFECILIAFLYHLVL